MNRLLIIGICMLFFVACNSYPKAEDPLDAAREFIDASLKGDFDKANFYMLQDAQNQALMDKVKVNYRSRSAAERAEYKDANIIILEEEALNDSAEIINYKNSYDNIARKARVVKQNGNWLVDLKYTFDGNL